MTGDELYDHIYEISKKLNKKEKKILFSTFARVMEKAYRRAVQQTLHLNDNNAILPEILDDPAKYRYDKDLKFSYGLDGFKSTAIDRLLAEEGYLIHLKIHEKENP